MSSERFQVVIIGAGLVGAAAALALGRQGVRVALIERQPPDVPAETWDTRIYAISPASQRFLERFGAWQRLDAQRIQPVFRMDVAGDTSGA
ncbi:MAG: 2-octaprenyl-3-methyl-6-methoxy-1,4-benzoquinol hydroxylase, partial [Hydrogenophilales bacterium 17-62-8]